MTLPRLRRRTLVGTAGIVAIALLIGGLLVVHGRSSAGARRVARAYVDLIAHGGRGDLQRLWAMEYTDHPGAMRSAGEILVGATQRIEVLRVGPMHKVDPPASVSYEAPFTRFGRVDVSYRIDGHEDAGLMVLGGLDGYSGTAAWRVVVPLAGSIDWSQGSVAGADVFVGGVRQVRRPQLEGVEEAEQPLYPAVYPTQARMDPYFVSAREQVVVPAGDATPAPALRRDPTALTKRRIRAAVLAKLHSCGRGETAAFEADCPLERIAELHGGDWWNQRSWWRGFVAAPKIVIDGAAITIRGGSFRMLVGGRSRLIRFEGTGSYVLDNQTWTPALPYGGIELTEAGR